MDIVRTSLFERSLKKLGASAADPTVGDVIQGLGGARKVRFAMAGRGKSGGGRAIYVLVTRAGVAYLLLAYSKAEQAELSNAQRKVLAEIVKELTDG